MIALDASSRELKPGLDNNPSRGMKVKERKIKYTRRMPCLEH